MCFCSTFSSFYEKWVIYILVNSPHLCVHLRCRTYGGDHPFAPCHELIVILLHDPKASSSSLYESSPSLGIDCDGVFGSSSSYYGVPSLCSTSVS